MTKIWTRTKAQYPRNDKGDLMESYDVCCCPNDGNLVIPFVGNMGDPRFGICSVCGSVEWVKVNEMQVRDFRFSVRLAGSWNKINPVGAAVIYNNKLRTNTASIAFTENKYPFTVVIHIAGIEGSVALEALRLTER